MDEKEKEEKDKYFSLFLKIAIGFLIIVFVFPFAINQFFADWTKSGTFGDTFGALNALFSGLALAGVIVTILIQRKELKNQRLELSLQRNEMKETRKEFLLNRTTNLVYNQLERFEKALSELNIIMPNGTKLEGNDAIIYLYDNENFVYKTPSKSEKKYKTQMKSAIIELLKIYTPNKSELEKFSHSLNTSVEVLKRLIYKTNLGIEELDDLKNLFFVNIGFRNIAVIERVVQVAENQFNYLTNLDFEENNLNPITLTHVEIFLSSVTEFYNLKLTKENFEISKSNWIDKLGKLEK